MSWVRNSRSAARLTAAIILLSAAGAAAANVLVVRSSGPSARSYPPGRSLPDNAPVALRGGDTLVVLDARGTRTFRGPGNFRPNVAAQAASGVSASTGRRARIGAVRSAGILPATPTTIWHLDVSQGGNMCVADPTNVMLWRADSSRNTTLNVAGPAGTSRSLQWPAGSATLGWPGDLPISDGAEYQVRQAGTAVPSRIRFRTTRIAEPSDLAAVAGALIEAGCQDQLDLLVETAPQQ